MISDSQLLLCANISNAIPVYHENPTVFSVYPSSIKILERLRKATKSIIQRSVDHVSSAGIYTRIYNYRIRVKRIAIKE